MATNGETRIDPDGVRAGATGLAGVGTAFTETANTLKASLRGESQPWGEDSFAKDYLPAAEAISEAVGAVAAALTRIAENLTAQADAHPSTDEPSAQTFGNTQV